MSKPNHNKRGCAKQRGFLILLLLLLGMIEAVAQDPRRYSVELSVVINRNPAEIRLSWNGDGNATEYVISRKPLEGKEWNLVAALTGSQTSWTDTQAASGSVYEYQVIKKTNIGFTGYGYTAAAIDRPLVDNRGRALVIVEQSLIAPLDFELQRFAQDLAGDGWTVEQKPVSASASPASVKEMIKASYNQAQGALKAVILVGHVPVPYSGNIAPDKHEDHRGAWPADAYYADINGDWTDHSVNSTTAERPVNRNIPGDGKFDQSIIPSPVEMQVGRIDLSSLTCYVNKPVSRNEVDLTRQYFNKNHAFRQAQLQVQSRGIIYNDVAPVPPEPAIAYAWRTFTSLLGSANVEAIGTGDFLPKSKDQYYLWGAATSGGGWTYANGVSTADELAVHNMKVIFTFFCSSYFGDWNNESNYLRAILANAGGPLTTAYGSRPTWLCHGMGVGETIGHASIVTMDNKEGGLYPPHLLGTGMVHTSLLGDPTLRMVPVPPPTSLSGRIENGNLMLSWNASPAPSLARYYIYKSQSRLGGFVKIGETEPGQTSFAISSFSPEDVFQVRAVNLTTGNNGSYYNASQGAFYINHNSDPKPVVAPAPPKSVEVLPVAANTIRIRWVPNSSNQQGFIIQRKAANEANFVEVGSAAYDKVEFRDSSLTVPNSYTYRVLAYNSGGTSAPSEPATCSNGIAVSDFMYFDNISQGNWKDKYGSLGRTITLQSTNLPPNLSITFSNIFHANYGWSDDNRLLQPEGNTQRLTAWWANGMPWGIDVDSRDDVTRSIAFYFVDWDRKNRSFDFEAYDVTTQKLLFKQVVGDHQNGVYIVCSIKGRVFYKITPRTLYQGQLLLGMFLDSAPTAAPPVITPNGGAFAGKVQVGMSAPSGTQIRYTIDGSEPSEASAQYSAPFTLAASATVKARGFRAGYAPSQTVSASFQNSLVTTFGAMGSDTSTKGGWRGVYGGEGYLLPIAGSVTPAYSELNFPTVSTWVWQDTTSDTRGQIKPASADRMAACWYAKDLLQFDVAVLDTQLHCLALYFVDWDNRGRRQIVEVLDMNGKVMDKTELSDFSGGVYLRYKLKGQVRIRITRVAGDNAVLNGMFFDEGPVEVTPVAPVQSVAKSSDGRALFTFAAQTGSTICVDVSSDLKTWVHTGNNVVVDGKIQLKVDESNWHPGRFYRCHTAH